MTGKIVLLYYKYVHVPRPKDQVIQQRAICQELGLKGRILIAQEGINGTLEGDLGATEAYIKYMDSHPDFKDISFKKSTGDGKAFPKLIVRARKEIVTSELGDEDINPNEVTGKYLDAETLQKWFENGESFKIIDMRNDYEFLSGHFEGSINPKMENFRDLKKTVAKFTDLKNERILTVCTGGVRCEKASGYLVSKGFKDVWQLKDGIVTYMEKFPNKKFKGKLYVFDNRILTGFETDKPEHEVIGKCETCGNTSEYYVNCAWNGCHRHFISCVNCSKNGLSYCNDNCEQNYINEKNQKVLAV